MPLLLESFSYVRVYQWSLVRSFFKRMGGRVEGGRISVVLVIPGLEEVSRWWILDVSGPGR